MEEVKKALEVKSNPVSNQKMSTRQLVVMAMMAAISIVLVYAIHFPIFPAAGFLEYDPADISILIGTFAYGPVAGFILTVIVSIIQGMTVSAASGPIGIIMHIVATGSCTLIAGTIYWRHKTKKSAAIALVVGTLVMAGAMAIMNLILTPIFMGAPREAVMAMMLPIIIPFNLIKAGANCIITFILYKPLSTLIKKEH